VVASVMTGKDLGTIPHGWPALVVRLVVNIVTAAELVVMSSTVPFEVMVTGGMYGL
jgi:hypothetical protein